MNLLYRLLILCPAMGLASASEPPSKPLAVSPVFRVIGSGGAESLASTSVSAVSSSTGLTPAFHAVFEREWPTGLVPLFPVEKDGNFELRRLPPKGRESFTDPLFFALPRPDETNASRITGRWSIQSINSGNHRHRLAMDLAADGDRIAGRLDQDTDYRFAHLTGGTWRTNHLFITIEYINDRYELTADLLQGKLIGTWRRTDDSDQGTWEATRDPAPVQPSAQTLLPLYEWRSPDGRRRYRTGESSEADGWQRVDPPLGRVWPIP